MPGIYSKNDRFPHNNIERNLNDYLPRVSWWQHAQETVRNTTFGTAAIIGVARNQVAQQQALGFPKQEGGLWGTGGEPFDYSNSPLIDEGEEAQILSPEEANEEYGIDNFLTFKTPVTRGHAIRSYNQSIKNLRLHELSRTGQQGFSGLSASLAGYMMGSVFDPAELIVNIAVPGVSAGARLGGGAIRTFGRSVAQGTKAGIIANTAIEIPYYLNERGKLQQYELTDSVANIAFGGAFGGIVGGSVGLYPLFRNISMKQKIKWLDKATKQMQAGEPVRLDGELQQWGFENKNRANQSEDANKAFNDFATFRKFGTQKQRVEQELEALREQHQAAKTDEQREAIRQQGEAKKHQLDNINKQIPDNKDIQALIENAEYQKLEARITKLQSEIDALKSKESQNTKSTNAITKKTADIEQANARIHDLFQESMIAKQEALNEITMPVDQFVAKARAADSDTGTKADSDAEELELTAQEASKSTESPRQKAERVIAEDATQRTTEQQAIQAKIKEQQEKTHQKTSEKSVEKQETPDKTESAELKRSSEFAELYKILDEFSPNMDGNTNAINNIIRAVNKTKTVELIEAASMLRKETMKGKFKNKDKGGHEWNYAAQGEAWLTGMKSVLEMIEKRRAELGLKIGASEFVKGYKHDERIAKLLNNRYKSVQQATHTSILVKIEVKNFKSPNDFTEENVGILLAKVVREANEKGLTVFLESEWRRSNYEATGTGGTHSAADLEHHVKAIQEIAGKATSKNIVGLQNYVELTYEPKKPELAESIPQESIESDIPAPDSTTPEAQQLKDDMQAQDEIGQRLTNENELHNLYGRSAQELRDEYEVMTKDIKASQYNKNPNYREWYPPEYFNMTYKEFLIRTALGEDIKNRLKERKIINDALTILGKPKNYKIATILQDIEYYTLLLTKNKFNALDSQIETRTKLGLDEGEAQRNLIKTGQFIQEISVQKDLIGEGGKITRTKEIKADAKQKLIVLHNQLKKELKIGEGDMTAYNKFAFNEIYKQASTTQAGTAYHIARNYGFIINDKITAKRTKSTITPLAEADERINLNNTIDSTRSMEHSRLTGDDELASQKIESLSNDEKLAKIQQTTQDTDQSIDEIISKLAKEGVAVDNNIIREILNYRKQVIRGKETFSQERYDAIIEKHRAAILQKESDRIDAKRKVNANMELIEQAVEDGMTYRDALKGILQGTYINAKNAKKNIGDLIFATDNRYQAGLIRGLNEIGLDYAMLKDKNFTIDVIKALNGETGDNNTAKQFAEVIKTALKKPLADYFKFSGIDTKLPENYLPNPFEPSHILYQIGKLAFRKRVEAAKKGNPGSVNIFSQKFRAEAEAEYIEHLAKSLQRTIDIERTGKAINDMQNEIYGHNSNRTNLFHDLLKSDKFYKEVAESMIKGRTLEDTIANQIDTAYNNIDTNPKHFSLRKQLTAHKILFFKDAESWYSLYSEFNSKPLRDIFRNNIRYKSLRLGAYLHFGDRPGAALDAIVKETQARASKAKQKDPTSAITGIGNHHAILDIILGTIHTPDNYRLAWWAQSLRGVQALAHLGKAMLSSIPGDLIGATIQMKRLNVPISQSTATIFREITDIATNAISNIRNKDRTIKSMREQIGTIIGIGTEGWQGIGMGSTRYMIGQNENKIGKFSNTIFKWSLLDSWTSNMRMVTARMLSHEFATRRYTNWDELANIDRELFQQYGINKAEYAYIMKYMVKTLDDGRDYLTPISPEHLSDTSITEYLHATKSKGTKGEDTVITKEEIMETKHHLSNGVAFLLENRLNMSIPLPGVRTMRIASAGQKAGTPIGEIARMTTQLLLVPIEIATRIFPDYFDKRPGESWGAAAYKNKHILAFYLAQSLFYGYIMSGIVKPLFEGKTPTYPTEDVDGILRWSLRTGRDALLQSGFAGIYADTLLKENYGFEGLFGPGVDDAFSAFKAGKKAVSGDLTGAGRGIGNLALDNIPFANLFYTEAAMNYLMVYYLQEILNPGSLKRYEKRQRQLTGRDYWIRPSELYAD